MKKILLSCACCLLAVGLLAGCDEEVEDVTPVDPNAGVVEPSGDDDGTGAGGDGSDTKEIVFGFSVDGVMNYMDGGTVSGHAYEGTLTTDVAEASKITLEESETKGAYYLSFDNGGTTNWITIIENNGHTNLSYATEKALLYYNAEYECWGNADMDYFLCYNSTYKCLYATAIGDTRYGLETSTPSPIAALYYTDGSAVTGLVGYELVAPTTLTISGATEVYVDSSITLTVTTETGADKSVTWSWVASEGSEGVVTVEGGKVTGVTAGEVVVTATSTVATGVSGSINITVLDVPTEFPYQDGESYWFGYEYNESLYSFTGAIVSSNYGGVTTETNSAVSVILNAVEGGYTLSFKDSTTRSAQYIGFDSSNHFSISSEATIWQYNAIYDTFTYEASGTTYFIGNYYGTSGTQYDELRVSEIGYLDGTKSSSYDQYAAHLYAQGTPSTITITGADSVSAGDTLTLGITTEDKASHDVTWSITSGEEYATIDEYGVLAATSAGSVTVSAVSVKNSSVTDTKNIEVVEEGAIVTTEITAQYIINNFTRDDSSDTDEAKTTGESGSYAMGSGSGSNANNAEKYGFDVIGGATMNFGAFDVEWFDGNTATKLWTGNQIRIYHNSTGVGGGLKITPHEDYKITSFYLYDSDGKLANTSLSIINGESTTALTSGTDYNITGSNKYIETVEGFSTQYTLQFMNTATSSNRIDAESIKITCAKVA